MNLEPRGNRYIDPYTNFGFRKLFGTDVNKGLLISFLNALFNGEQVVTNVSYRNNEHIGASKDNRRGICPENNKSPF